MKDHVEGPRRVRQDALVSGVVRAVADLPEPDQSVIRLRYGIGERPLGEEETAEQGKDLSARRRPPSSSA